MPNDYDHLMKTNSPNDLLYRMQREQRVCSAPFIQICSIHFQSVTQSSKEKEHFAIRSLHVVRAVIPFEYLSNYHVKSICGKSINPLSSREPFSQDFILHFVCFRMVRSAQFPKMSTSSSSELLLSLTGSTVNKNKP